MWKCKKSAIKSFGAENEIEIVKIGFLKYAAIQQNKTIIAKGFRLKKYYNPYTGVPGSGAIPGRIMRDCGHWDDIKKSWVEGTWKYYLKLENPKTYKFETVCVWK